MIRRKPVIKVNLHKPGKMRNRKRDEGKERQRELAVGKQNSWQWPYNAKMLK